MGGAGRYPAVGGAPLALWTPLPLEDGARLGGAPLGAAPLGTAACSGGTPPRLLTQETNIRQGLDERAETKIPPPPLNTSANLSSFEASAVYSVDCLRKKLIFFLSGKVSADTEACHFFMFEDEIWDVLHTPLLYDEVLSFIMFGAKMPCLLPLNFT